MKKMDEVQALAIIFGNTKRKKRKENLITIAKAFQYLVKVYGSQQAVAQKVGLSAEMIRQFLTVLKLEPKVQELFLTRQIDSVDTAKELVRLKERDKQIALAQKIANLTSKDARDIKRAVAVDNIRVRDAVRVVLKEKRKRLHLFMLDLEDDVYRGIRKKAKALKTTPAELMKDVIKKWLADKK